ncbi:hypothetical protein A4X09_0g4088, partial [Tilletia walkeri]
AVLASPSQPQEQVQQRSRDGVDEVRWAHPPAEL